MEHLNEIAAAFRQASIPCAAREPLSRHTSFQIGGPAALFCEPQNKRQLARAIAVCRQAGVRYYLLGKGTNILFADEGFDGVVIHIGEVLGNIECNGLSVTAQAGVALSKVCIAAANEGLSGLEFAYGIPGCVGGAVYMNAGAYGGEIKDVLACATFLDETGAERTLQAGELQLGYRTSVFEREPWCILIFSIKCNNNFLFLLDSKTHQAKDLFTVCRFSILRQCDLAGKFFANFNEFSCLSRLILPNLPGFPCFFPQHFTYVTGSFFQISV